VHHRRACLDFPMRSAALSVADKGGISRFPRKGFPPMLGVSDPAKLPGGSRYRRPGCSFRFLLKRRPLEPYQQFRGSMPSLDVPLSKLRRGPCEQRRMTRGRSGSELLLRMVFHPRHLTGFTGAQQAAEKRGGGSCFESSA
jgi:hypothetical protein